MCRQRQWVFVVMTNMEDACGREHDPAQKYLAEICYVDLDVLSQKRIAELLAEIYSYGWAADEDVLPEVAVLALEYGYKARMAVLAAPSYPLRLRGQAFALANDLGTNTIRAKLAEPCNQIGSTWEEYMRGDVMAPLERRAAEILAGKPVEEDMTSDLLIKMYSGGQTIRGPAPDVLVKAARLLESRGG